MLCYTVDGRWRLPPFHECLDLYKDYGNRVPDYNESARKKFEETSPLELKQEAKRASELTERTVEGFIQAVGNLISILHIPGDLERLFYLEMPAPPELCLTPSIQRVLLLQFIRPVQQGLDSKKKAEEEVKDVQREESQQTRPDHRLRSRPVAVFGIRSYEVRKASGLRFEPGTFVSENNTYDTVPKVAVPPVGLKSEASIRQRESGGLTQ